MYPNEITQMGNIYALFNPENVVLLGEGFAKNGGESALMKNLLSSGYRRNVYYIGKERISLEGLESFANLNEIDGAVDLAIIKSKLSQVSEYLRQCADVGIRTVVLIATDSASEVDELGLVQSEILDICSQENIRLLDVGIGGVWNPWQEVALSNKNIEVPKGNFALVAQCGALTASSLEWAGAEGIGFSGVASVGPNGNVEVAELIEHFAKDDRTDCILLYLENVIDGKHFLDMCTRVSASKPIIAIRAGRSTQGARIAASHTGALVANDMVYDAVFKQAGIVRAESIKEMFDIAKGFASKRIVRGRNLCIISNAGGPAVLATDRLIDQGCKLAQLSEYSRTKMEQILPNTIDKRNPFEFSTNVPVDGLSRVVDICMDDDEVDGVLFLYAADNKEESAKMAHALVKKFNHYSKPLITCWSSKDDGMKILRSGNIPAYLFPEVGAGVLAKLVEYGQFHQESEETEYVPPIYDMEKALSIIQYAGVQDRERLTEIEAKGILNCYHISTPKSYLATNVKEAEYYAVQLGFPVVMKVVSPDIGHKIDVGGVILNIKDYKEAEVAYNDVISNIQTRVPDAEIMGVLVEKMINKRYELIIGAVRDKVFGPAIVFGMGGSLVELWNDAHMALAPLSREDAIRLIRLSRAYTLISGFRGMPSIDKDELVDVLVNFSNLIHDLKDLVEVDINPFSMDEEGGIALDAHMLIK